jgi:hypothetical protein
MSEFISGPQINAMKLVHEDDRRTIREVEMNLPDGTIRRVTSLAIHGPRDGEQSVALGNHYHDNPEYFAVLGGNPTVLTADKDTPKDVTVRTFPEGGHVVMKPGEVHTFNFSQPGELISSMDGAFDPTDLHPQKLAAPATQDVPTPEA